jgi:hypothetical protein
MEAKGGIETGFAIDGDVRALPAAKSRAKCHYKLLRLYWYKTDDVIIMSLDQQRTDSDDDLPTIALKVQFSDVC